MNSNTYIIQYLSMTLNDFGGTPFNTYAFIILGPLISRLNLSQVIGS